MRIGVIGINHKQADVSVRESIAKAILRHFSIGQTLTSAVLLLTCNRAEIYFSGDNLTELHQRILAELREEIKFEFEQKCYSFFGHDCFIHLAHVTSGLDSAIVAETEIQGQVKQAYETAKSCSHLSSELHFLFQKCLKIGKTIRSSCLDTRKTLPALEHAIHFSAEHHFKGTLPSPLFIGTGEINVKVARFLASRGLKNLYFCNRTHSKAHELAEELQGRTLAWSDLPQRWSEFDWVISAVQHTSPIIMPQTGSGENKLLIDLAVPRNIHPEVAGKILNIDDLNRLQESRKQALYESIQEAHLEIEATVRRYQSRLSLRSFEAHSQAL